MQKTCLLTLLFATCSLAAQAAQPSAIVNEVSDPKVGVQPMDLLPAGTRLTLSKGASLSLGYLKSCREEIITGGTVIIGTEASKVQGGTVTPSQTDCDGGSLVLNTAESGQSGVVAFRRPAKPTTTALPQSQRTLHGTSPVLVAPPGSSFTLTRLDGTGTPIVVAIPSAKSKLGTIDMAKAGTSLPPGSLYRIDGPGHSLVIQIASDARDGAAPVGRLIVW